MYIEELKQEFMTLCRPLAERPNVAHSEFIEEKRACIFSMTLRNSKIELVYCWKWENLAPPSVLYCRVYPNKNVPLYLHLPELISALGVEDFRACYYPCIENTQRMRGCFSALLAVMDDYIPHAESGRCDAILKRRFDVDFWGKPLGQEDEGWNYHDPDARSVMKTVDRLSESIMVDRFTEQDAYLAFLNGDWEKSLELYQKLKKSGLSQYENDLCAFMSRPENRGYKAMPANCMAIADYKKSNGSLRELGYMLLCAIPWSLLYCAIIAGVNRILAAGTHCFFGVHPLFGVFPGLASGVFGYILFQKQVLRLMKRYQELDFAEMMDHHPKLRKIAALIFALVLVFSLCLSIGLPLMGTRFYEDRALIYLDGIRYETIEYRQISAIYHISGRYNDYGDFIGRPSYVLVLQDGTAVDLDCTGSYQEQTNVIQTIFRDFQVIHVESHRNLP